MIFIPTNFYDINGDISYENTSGIYNTDCGDTYFQNIINLNRQVLQEEFICTNRLYVLKEDTIDIENPISYASVSFQQIQRFDTLIFRVCVVTKETSISMELMRDFLIVLLDNLETVGVQRIAFTNNPIETTHSIISREHQQVCVDNMLRELGLI